MVDVQTVSIVIAATAVVVAAVSIIMQNRKAEKSKTNTTHDAIHGSLARL